MGGFLPDFIQNVANGLHSVGIPTPELGLTEGTGGSNVNASYMLPNGGGNYVSNSPIGLNGIQTINGKTYDFRGTQPVLVSNGSTPTPQPVLHTTNTQTGGTDTGTSGLATSSNGYSNATGTYNPSQVQQYDQSIGVLKNALNRSGNQLGIAQENINNQYGTNLNELDSAKQQAQNSYNTSGTQNQQSLRTNKNTINDQASVGLRGLLRTLGMYGAGGSSTAQYTAPGAVAAQATQQRNGAGQTFATNQQNLDTNWNNFGVQDNQSRQKLNDWKSQQLNSAQSQSDTAKQSLLQQLADLQGTRAAYTGGNYALAAQPYADQANALSTQIDNLAQINPTYTGVVPTYTAPTLSSYEAKANTAVTPGQSTSGDYTSPYLQMLLGLKKQNQLG
jgi:hypothetical protein